MPNRVRTCDLLIKSRAYGVTRAYADPPHTPLNTLLLLLIFQARGKLQHVSLRGSSLPPASILLPWRPIMPGARRKVKLTKTLIAECAPLRSEYAVWDTACEGLHVRIFPTGAKSYAVF